MKFKEIRHTGKILFLIVAGISLILFMLAGNSLVKQLAHEEKQRMDIWAHAIQRLAKADTNHDPDFLLSIISRNNSIPAIVLDSASRILDFHNLRLPDKRDNDDTPFDRLSEQNRNYLDGKISDATKGKELKDVAKTNPHFIEVEIYPGTSQFIYYEDSILLKRLSFYPYLQLAVLTVITLMIYLSLMFAKKAEQDKLWIGLSKETAHQLGTPISSLLAWNQYLEASGTDHEVTKEIGKDIDRLSVIAERFSKIGSMPELNPESLNDTIRHSLGYISPRISQKVIISLELSNADHTIFISTPLFEWVVENMIKNAVDAMEGVGHISIRSGIDRGKVWIEMKDSGKGISHKNLKNIFIPGYSTKRRGWGLGLTLVKRIIEDYHGGKIFVKESYLGKGTTFRIELPCIHPHIDKSSHP